VLKQVTFLAPYSPYTKPANIQPLDIGMKIFPNYKTGALMGVKYPIEVEQQLLMLLRHTHKERGLPLPLSTLHGYDAANRLGISHRVFQRWVEKGWIYSWTNWMVVQNQKAPYPPNWSSDEQGRIVVPGATLFSELEVEALRLAKPCDL
jgi:hypothetical protein